jgi:hypothetical protein
MCKWAEALWNAVQIAAPLSPLLTLAATRIRDSDARARPLRVSAAVLHAAVALSVPLHGVRIPALPGLWAARTIAPIGGPRVAGSMHAIMTTAMYGMIAIKGVQLCIAWPGTDEERGRRGVLDIAKEFGWYLIPLLRVEGEPKPLESYRDRVDQGGRGGAAGAAATATATTAASTAPSVARAAANGGGGGARLDYVPTRASLGTDTTLGVVVRSAVLALIAGSKLILIQWAVPRVHALLTSPQRFASGPLAGLERVWRVSALVLTVILTTWHVDLNSAAINLVTMGRYALLDVFRFGPLATSPAEFWGQRYNLLVSKLLSDAVNAPLKRAGCNPALGVMATFAASGALHVLVVHCAMNRCGRTSTMAFFLLHGSLCVFQGYVRRRSDVWYRRLFTGLSGWAVWHTCLFGTSPLYMGMFADHADTYLRSSFPSVFKGIAQA